jgi:type II secretory pathway component PulF
MSTGVSVKWFFESYILTSSSGAKPRQLDVLTTEPTLAHTALSPADDEQVRKIEMSDFERKLKIKINKKVVPAAELYPMLSAIVRCMEMGASLTEAIDVSLPEAKLPVTRGVFSVVKHKLRQGDKLSAAFSYFPATFDPAMLAMLRAGEASGDLKPVLKNIVEMGMRGQSLGKKLFGAFLYPAIIIVFAIGVTLLVSYLVVPKMAEVYDSLGVTLPTSTLLLISFSNFLKGPFFAPPIILVSLFGRGILKKIFTSDRAHYLYLRIPVIGEVLCGAIIVRCFRVLGMLMSAGVPPREAFAIVAQVAGNPEYSRYFNLVAARILAGEDFYPAFLAERGKIPGGGMTIATKMKVAAFTGKMKEVLLDAATLMDEDLQLKAESLPKVLQPILIVCVTCLVGGIVAALYLPTFILARDVLNNTAGASSNGAPPPAP